MSLQRTFRSVEKPIVQEVSTALAGGNLTLNEGTYFIFSGAAVGTVSGLVGHEYLVDGQRVTFVNTHSTNDLVFAIGAFSYTIPAGYKADLYFDKDNVSFFALNKEAELKALEDDIATNASDISTEEAARIAEDLTFLKLDGSRVMTGALDMNSNAISNVAAGSSSDQAINKGQFDTAVASLTSQISANATALSWREPIRFITKWVTGTIPANGAAVVDSTFSGGNARVFEDDDAPSQFVFTDINFGDKALFLKDGSEPKLMVCRDDAGTRRWYDETEVDLAKQLERQVQENDTFIVENDLLDSPDAHENQAIYHIEGGTPKTAIKIGDIDWQSATGIDIATGYNAGPGGETVLVGDTIQQAIQKLDGNIDANAVDAANNLATAVSNLQAEIDADVAAESAVLSAEIDADILASEAAHAATMASTANGEGASLVGVEDALSIYTSTTVEGALAEVKQLADQNESDITGLQSDVAANQSAIASNDTDIANNATAISDLETSLASTSAAEGASKVGVEDSAGKFTGTTVEAVLAELDDKINNLNLVEQDRGLYEAAASGVNNLNLATAFVDVLGGGGVAQDLSAATYASATVIRDGAVLIGSVGYTIAGGVITFTADGGGDLIAGEVVEIKVLTIS